MPLLGWSLDKRALRCVGEVCHESKICVLMCLAAHASIIFLKKLCNQKDEPRAAILSSTSDKLYGEAARNDP
eukprot:4250626-Karenia_brevis.AAC.1